MEVPPRFELGNESFADSCLTAWPRYHFIKTGTQLAFLFYLIGAGDEARTRYLHLGKVALYRMSYTRISAPKRNRGAARRNRISSLPEQYYANWCLRSESNQRHADFQSAALPTELQRHIEQSIKLCSDALYGDPERTRTVDLQRDRLAC